MSPSSAGIGRNLALFFISLTVVCLCGELLIRWVSATRPEDASLLGRISSHAGKTGSKIWKSALSAYLTQPQSAHIIYDPALGWAPRPGGVSADGLYVFDQASSRSESPASAPSLEPDKGIVRIAIFGDSFTLGFDSPFKESWGYLLERSLNERGMAAEVLNFGVGGYGMDQAYLRWDKSGRPYRPNIVILGLRTENIRRNVNLFRPFYADSGVPFFKPRFLLEDGGLKLINAPTPVPEEIISILDNFDRWEHSGHERWKEGPMERLLSKSSLFALCRSIVKASIPATKPWTQSDQDLALAIILAFKRGVESEQGRFITVFLPHGRPNFSESAFLDKIKDSVELVDPQERFISEADRLGLDALIPSHYSLPANRIVADSLADHILNGASE